MSNYKKSKVKAKAIATAITGFYPDGMYQKGTGRKWLTVSYRENQDPSIDFPKSVQYEGKVYYWMSFNSDKMIVSYASAGWRSYHERYCE